MADDDVVARAEAALEGITPGPWTQAPESGERGWYWVEHVDIDGHGIDVALRVTNEPDAELITAAPALVRELVDEVKKLRAAVQPASDYVSDKNYTTLWGDGGANDVRLVLRDLRLAQGEVERLRVAAERKVVAVAEPGDLNA